MGVLRNWFLVWFFVCFGFRVFWGFCGWVPEALCNPAQMRMPDGPAFRGSRRPGAFNTIEAFKRIISARKLPPPPTKWYCGAV